LISIFIVADSVDRADAMSASLEEDDRFEISAIELADVVLCLGVSLRRLPRRGKPVVAVSPDADGDAPFDDTLKAWLPTSATLENIAAALEAAASGLTVLTRQQAKRAFRDLQASGQAEAPPNAEHLTAREHEVLQMMAAGLGNKDIAGRLRISPNTAKFHVAQILAKLGAGSRTEAVSMAIRRGLVPV
jgi:DNA-binding NarL/FixJ family response regulator